MRPEELAGRKGKQADGSAKSRQAYLGCVFLQHKRDEEGHPIRDHDSTTYIFSFDTVEKFCLLLRKEGCFLGSGVIEAGCKSVIGARCKQSGMFWSEGGAENILALRCIKLSRTGESFWKFRANEHAARNDTLPLAA